MIETRVGRVARLLFWVLFLAVGAGGPAAADGVPIVLGTSYTLPSKILGDSREINVWLPSSYGEGAGRYTVLYVLDGGRDQDFPHIAGLGQLGELSGTYETLIVVGVQTRARLHDLTPKPDDPRFARAFPEGGGAPLFRRFLREEVVPFIAARFRTGARRALMGESLAGLFVVDTFLKDPGAFDDYIAVSPSLWWDARALSRNAPALLAHDDLAGRRIYLTMGDEGPLMHKAMYELVAALGTPTPRGLNLTFIDRGASETHATIYHPAALDALRRLYALPPAPMGPLPWYMIDGASPP